MDIRWKNTADRAKAFLKENISSVTGTAAFILGLIMLVFLSDKVKYYVSSKETWGFGIIMNVFMGIAVYLILSDVLKNIYRDWLPENSDFYSSWKSVWRKQQRILWTAGGALFFIAMFFLISQMTYSRYYYSNFAFGYLRAIWTASNELLYGMSHTPYLLDAAIQHHNVQLLKRMQ